MTMTLHIANRNYSSWSLRAWVLMRELHIPFTEQIHYYGDDNRSEFSKFSPSALVPCLDDNGTIVWDSFAIAEYLYEGYPAIWPLDKVARAFARSAAAEMHSGFMALRSICTMNCGVRVHQSEIGKALQRDLNRLDAIFTQGLQQFGGPFLAGDKFTAVDAFYAPIAFRAQTYGLKLSDDADNYLNRLLQVPSMQQWYHDGLAETHRYPGHEQSIIGEITADYRAT